MVNYRETLSKEMLKSRVDFFSRLEKFVKTPQLYIDFPEIPKKLRVVLEMGAFEEISIYKKWASYHLVLDGKAGYVETLEPLDINPIFSPSENELDSEHYWVKVRYLCECVLEWNSEVELFEEHLKVIVYQEKSIALPQDTFDKVRELQWDVPPRDYNPSYDRHTISPPIYWLSGITLVQKWDLYVVLDSDIHFTREELEHIKKELS